MSGRAWGWGRPARPWRGSCLRRGGRRLGIYVRHITLFVFGGMAHMESEPRGWGAELTMAVAGPVTSVVVGIVFLHLAGLGVEDMDAQDPMAALSKLEPVAGIWIALIGWFLNKVAMSGYRQVMVHERLGDLPVTRVMHRDFHAVQADATVQDFVDGHGQVRPWRAQDDGAARDAPPRPQCARSNGMLRA